MDQLGVLEASRDTLEVYGIEAETAGDPILAGELRRYVDALTDTLDKMYVWAGNL